MQFPHTRKISPEWKICVFRGFCVRKNNQREKWNIFHTEFTENTELFLRNEQNICYQKQLESTEFVVDFVTTAGAVGTDDEDDKTISQKDDKNINALSSHHLIINPIPRRHGGLEILEDSFSLE